MKRWVNLSIVVALFFAGALALSLDHFVLAITLFVSGIIMAIVFNRRKMLPE